MDNENVRRGALRITEGQWEVFLDTLAATHNITHSAKKAGFHHTSARFRIRHDEEFRALAEDAKASAIDNLKRCAFDRALNGHKNVVVSMGTVVRDPDNGGYLYETKIDNNLLWNLLRTYDGEVRDANRPASVVVAIPVELQPDPPATPDEPAPINPVL